MNTRRMVPNFGRHLMSAAVAGLGLLAWTSLAAAQTISAGTVDGTAGAMAEVPITIDTGSANVAFFAVTFTVVAPGSSPAVTTAMDYMTADGVPGPDLKTAVAAQGKLAIGYAGVTISPPLSGSVQVGTLLVPIPDGASGAYEVQLSKASAGDSDGNKVALTASNGVINVGGVGPTPTPGPNTMSGAAVEGAPGNVLVPITVNTGENNVAFFAVTFTVVAQGGAPPVTVAMDYQTAVQPGPDLKTAVAAQAKLAIGYAGVTIDPPLSGVVEVGSLVVPVPDGAVNGSYEVQLSKISAGDSDGNKVTLTAVNGSISIGGVGPTFTPTDTPIMVPTDTPTTTPTSAPTNTATITPTPPPTNTPTNTPVPPTATATRTQTAGAPTPAPFDDDGGCQINAAGSSSAGWLLLIPAVGLLVMRRKRR
jgi:MYXO-CTERM domain-containing protein